MIPQEREWIGRKIAAPWWTFGTVVCRPDVLLQPIGWVAERSRHLDFPLEKSYGKEYALNPSTYFLELRYSSLSRKRINPAHFPDPIELWCCRVLYSSVGASFAWKFSVYGEMTEQCRVCDKRVMGKWGFRILTYGKE